MKKLALALGLLVIASPALATPMCNNTGTFFITSPGPWPMQINTKVGTTCQSTFQSGAIELGQTSVVTPPARGRLNLSGGTYVYTAPTSPGSDGFALRFCGTLRGQQPGCANLHYKVVVD